MEATREAASFAVAWKFTQEGASRAIAPFGGPALPQLTYLGGRAGVAHAASAF
jgi:hypothetical protein